jgi:rubrerythrin
MPQLAAEWHPTLNGDLTPADVLPGSNAPVWWRCSNCQREWEARVFKRAKAGRGCRDCGIARRTAARAKPAPGQSLADLMPELAAEWHPTLNAPLTPADVVPGSGKKVWWQCSKCRHEWETVVHSRARGSGCRECWLVRKAILRATPKPGQSYGDLYPDVAGEWHPTRNGDLNPTDVKPGSKKPRWWQCRTCGHEWEVAPQDRRRGEQCPVCAERQRRLTKSTPKAGRSLLDLYPDIAAEWHPTRNGSVTAADVNPGSKTRRWWQCRGCGHEWQTDPDHRTRGGRGCSKCSYQYRSRVKATPKPGESLAEKNPQLAAEWHPTKNGSVTPFDVRPRGRAKAWWQCRFGHEWYALVAPRVEGVGCPHCSIIGISGRQVRLEYELAAAGLPVEHGHPPIVVAGRRRPIKADIAMPDIRVIVEYDGSYYHARRVRTDREQTALLESAGWTVFRVRELPLPELGGHEISVLPTQSIKSLTLDVLRGLARIGYSASQMSAYTTDSRWWAEREANEALYKYRAKSLASEFPDVAAEFHEEKNGGITPDQVHPGSQAKFWWKCAVCDYEWYTAVHVRTAGHGCPPCSRRRGGQKRALPPPGESFADLFPETAEEWHPTRNGALTAHQVRPASSQRVWWRCAQGHEWEGVVADRRKSGCRNCSAAERAQKH